MASAGEQGIAGKPRALGLLTRRLGGEAVGLLSAVGGAIAVGAAVGEWAQVQLRVLHA